MELDSTDKYLQQCVQIDPLNISNEFTRVAAELAYWNEKYAEALRMSLHAKIQRERMHASLYFEKRKQFEAAGTKVTEAGLEAAIEVDPRYANLRDEEADANGEYARLRGVSEAVKTKKDMLVSLGAQVRAEMDDPVIRQQHRSHSNQDTDF